MTTADRSVGADASDYATGLAGLLHLAALQRNDGIVTISPEQLTNGLDRDSLAVVEKLADFLKTRRPA